MDKQLETIASELQELVVEVSYLQSSLKSDATQWNVVEAIENLSFELKRMNDREEGK